MLHDLATGWRVRINTSHNLRVDRSWGFDERRNADCHLIFVRDGHGSYRLDSEHVALDAGRLILLTPGYPHAARAGPGSPPYILPLRFDLLRGDRRWRPGAWSVHARVDQGPRPYFEAIHREQAAGVAGDALAQLRQQAAVVEILAALRRAIAPAHRRLEAPFAQLRRSLRAHPDRRLPVTAMAARAGVSEKHFIRAFRHRYGITPGAYAIACRIEQAGFLLAETDLPVHAIADRLGYPDAAGFSKQFRQRTGRSPVEHRRALRATTGERG